MRYNLLLLLCLDGFPPLKSYNSIGVIIPMDQDSLCLLIALMRWVRNYLYESVYLSADALLTVCSISSVVTVSFH